jgi:hypothetical protein
VRFLIKAVQYILLDGVRYDAYKNVQGVTRQVEARLSDGGAMTIGTEYILTFVIYTAIEPARPVTVAIDTRYTFRVLDVKEMKRDEQSYLVKIVCEKID